MAENSAQERTEEATPKRREDSRKKGQVPRSKELNTLTSLLAGGVGMSVFGRQIIDDISSILRQGLSFGHEAAFSTSVLPMQMAATATKFLLLLSPLFVLLVVTAIVSPISLGGWVFNIATLSPKAERISPFKGIARIFSSKSLMELFKAIAKFVLVASVTIYVISEALDTIFALPLQPLAQALATTGKLFIWCFLGFSSVLILVALVDIPYQLWDYKRQIKMSKQEIKDELKETDGKPEVKSAIRERQQEFSRQRMMAEVPKADVVITNPTHFSVALRYDQSTAGAPRVVAKGRDLVASRIREVAEAHGVALFIAPPLARALFSSTDLNQEIPGNLFLAVAQVLAYIFQLRRARVNHDALPEPPQNMSIPAEYSDAISTRGRA